MDTKASIEMEKAAKILKLLGDKTRLSMMKLYLFVVTLSKWLN
ncbi:hypothetical protein [Priestia megaterium]